MKLCFAGMTPTRQTFKLRMEKIKRLLLSWTVVFLTTGNLFLFITLFSALVQCPCVTEWAGLNLGCAEIDQTAIQGCSECCHGNNLSKHTISIFQHFILVQMILETAHLHVQQRAQCTSVYSREQCASVYSRGRRTAVVPC